MLAPWELLSGAATLQHRRYVRAAHPCHRGPAHGPLRDRYRQFPGGGARARVGTPPGPRHRGALSLGAAPSGSTREVTGGPPSAPSSATSSPPRLSPPAATPPS